MLPINVTCPRTITARAIAWIVTAAIVLTMTFSVAIVLVKTDHIHDYNGTRGGCATCAAVNIAGGIIKSLSTMYVALTLVTCGFLSSAWSSCPKALRRNHFSPVILKVRLNN